MSAFLGPVHEKMYRRILYQDHLAAAFLKLAADNNWSPDLAEQVDAAYPAARQEPLANIIDPNNIHGWLTVAVENCEARYAAVVVGILAEHPERLAELKTVMTAEGKAYELSPGADAKVLFNDIHDLLLDGMPCDFPFALSEDSDEEMIWQVSHCPHARAWQAADLDPDLYYELRDAWVQGALAGSGFIHERNSGEHRLKREVSHG